MPPFVPCKRACISQNERPSRSGGGGGECVGEGGGEFGGAWGERGWVGRGPWVGDVGVVEVRVAVRAVTVRAAVSVTVRVTQEDFVAIRPRRMGRHGQLVGGGAPSCARMITYIHIQ